MKRGRVLFLVCLCFFFDTIRASFFESTVLTTSLDSLEDGYSCDFHPTGKWFVVGAHYEDGFGGIYVFPWSSELNVIGNRVDKVSLGTIKNVYETLWSSDGTYLATISSSLSGEDLRIYLWSGGHLHFRGGAELGGSSRACCWSFDGRYIAAATNSEEYLEIYEFDGSDLISKSSRNLAVGIFKIDWSSDGNYIAVGTNTGDTYECWIYGWDGIRLSEDPLGKKDFGSYGCNAVHFHPSVKYVAVGTASGYSPGELLIYAWDGSSSFDTADPMQ
jgi:WD40 repeat protein